MPVPATIDTRPAVTVTRPLCPVADLADGRSHGFDPLDEGLDTMFIVRQGAALYGWRNACPHYNRARMAWKRHEYLTGDRSRIVCGAHGAQFEIDTGACVIGPCRGQTLTPVPLNIRDGAVFLAGPYAPGRPPRPGRSHP